MKITRDLDRGQAVELLPAQTQRLLDESGDAEIPSLRIEFRDRAVLQNRPLEGERLPGRQTPGFAHFALEFLPLLAVKKHRALSSDAKGRGRSQIRVGGYRMLASSSRMRRRAACRPSCDSAWVMFTVRAIRACS